MFCVANDTVIVTLGAPSSFLLLVAMPFAPSSVPVSHEFCDPNNPKM